MTSARRAGSLLSLLLLSVAGCGSETGPGEPVASADCPTMLRYDDRVYAGSSTVVDSDASASWPELPGGAEVSDCDDTGRDGQGAWFPDDPDRLGAVELPGVEPGAAIGYRTTAGGRSLVVVAVEERATQAERDAILASFATESPEPVAADRLRVTCSETGIEVDADAVAARADGVVLVVDSTLPAGSYLTWSSPDGPSGGDAITSRPVTYAVPPGALTLGCATTPGMDETGSVTVTDPQDHWREATTADLGCPSATAQPSWVAGLTGAGPTAEAAVDAMLAGSADTLGGALTARFADVGYAGPDTQTWIVAVDGVAHLTLAVTRRGDRFDAFPDQLCGGDGG